MDTTPMHNVLVAIKAALDKNQLEVAQEQCNIAIGMIDDEVNHEMKRLADALTINLPHGILDPKKIIALTEPVTISFELCSQPRYNGLNVLINGIDNIQDDAAYDKFADHSGDSFSMDDADNIPASFFMKSLIGTEPHPEVIVAFLTGLIRIEDVSHTRLAEIMTDWPKYLANTEIWETKLALAVNETEGNDS